MTTLTIRIGALVATGVLCSLARAQLCHVELSTRPQPVAYPIFPAVGDFDGNGRLDLVAGAFGAFYYYPDPDVNGFIAPPILLPPPYPLGSRVLPAQLTQDPHLDIVVTCGNQTDAILGLGDGTFATPLLNPISLGTMLGVPPISSGFSHVADVSNDGLDDLVLDLWDNVTGTTRETRVVINNWPNWTVSWSYPRSYTLGGLASGDLNGDGNVDICWTAAMPATGTNPLPHSVIDQLYVAFGDGVGGFAPPATFTIGIPVASPWQYVAAFLRVIDLDGDGFADAVMRADPVAGQFRVFYGHPTLGLEPAVTVTWPNPLTLSWDHMWLDFDADGDVDLVVPNCAGCPLLSYPWNPQPVFAPIGLEVLHCIGFRTYAQVAHMDLSSDVPSSHYWAPGDYDRDGDMDFVGLPAGYWPEAVFIRNRAVFGSGCPGTGLSPPGIWISNLTLGNPAFAIGMTGALPNTPCALGVSLGSSPTGGCGPVIDISPAALLLPTPAIGTTVTDSAGWAAIVMALPTLPSLAGATFFGQWFSPDPQGGFSFAGLNWAVTPGRTMVLW